MRLGSKPGISTLMLKAGGILPSSRLDGLFGSRLLEEGSLDQAAYYLERAVERIQPTIGCIISLVWPIRGNNGI